MLFMTLKLQTVKWLKNAFELQLQLNSEIKGPNAAALKLLLGFKNSPN
jgi:hypothetical protein